MILVDSFSVNRVQKHSVISLLVFSFLVLSCDRTETVDPQAEINDQVIAFVNVNVIPMDHEGVLEGYTQFLYGMIELLKQARMMRCQFLKVQRSSMARGDI